jgi:hypothetical protein
MFTQSQLKCSECNKIYVDPRNLPCGDAACNKCIERHFDAEKNQLKCFGCAEIHSIPEKGFPVCKFIASLLEKVNAPTFKNKKLGANLTEIKVKMDECKIEAICEALNEHYESIRSQIEIKTESVMIEIEKSREILLKDIENYENEVKTSIMPQLEILEKEYNELFDKSKLNETELNSNGDEIIEIGKNMLQKIDTLHRSIINFKKVNFSNHEIGIDSSLLGHLTHDIYSFDTFDSLKINLKDKLTSFNSLVGIATMDSGNLVIIYKDTNGIYIIAVFDNNLKLIRLRKLSILIPNAKNLLITYMNSFNDNIILNYSEEQYQPINGTYVKVNNMLSLNGKSFIVKKCTLNNQYTSICGDSKIIICYINGFIHIYDSDLKYLKNLGTSTQFPYYFGSGGALEMELLENQLFVRLNSKIIAINIESGVEEFFLDITATRMILSNNNLCLITNKQQDEFEIQVYSLIGKFLNSCKIDGYCANSILLFKDKFKCSIDKKSLELTKYY